MRYLHGVKHVTKDTTGYIYWRSVRVEHFSYSDDASEKQAALDLAADCRALEAAGIEVTSKNLSWYQTENYMQQVPDAIRRAADRICNAYGLKGLCDPGYISNIIAVETGRGDGRGNFTDTK